MAHNADGRSTKVHPHYCRLHPLPSDPLITAAYSTPSGSIPAAANMSLNASWQSSTHEKSAAAFFESSSPRRLGRHRDLGPSCHPTLHGRQCHHPACTSQRLSLLLLSCTVTLREENESVEADVSLSPRQIAGRLAEDIHRVVKRIHGNMPFCSSSSQRGDVDAASRRKLARFHNGPQHSPIRRVKSFGEKPRTPTLGCGVTYTSSKEHLLNLNEFRSDYMPSTINWAVQSSVDYLHMLIVSMKYPVKWYHIHARYPISVHDELWYLAKEEDKYRAALRALQIFHLVTRAMFAYMLGMDDLP